MKKQTLICDLDGTLYYQLGVQLVMALWLASYYLLHFWRFKELLALKYYRQFREKTKDDVVAQQFKIVAQKYHFTEEKVKEIVDIWLFKKPLKILPLFKDRQLEKILRDFKGDIIIYSDYPTSDKLQTLKMPYTKAYDATHPKISVLKPNPIGLYFIIADNKIRPDDILYIGDRDSKDGACARACQVDYIILPKLWRMHQHQKIKQMIGDQNGKEKESL